MKFLPDFGAPHAQQLCTNMVLTFSLSETEEFWQLPDGVFCRGSFFSLNHKKQVASGWWRDELFCN